VISQVALLCIRDLFDGDQALATVGFNGHVHAINRATGEREYPCLISLSVDRADFPRDENLREVMAEACVRHLRAIVSNHPYDLEPIEPLLDFDLSRFSFVDGFDAVSTLDSRPDLMHMSPTNFEHLVRQIFEAQGAEGWTTEQSHDDGVDAVIAKRTPLMGGLSIVQAKRYSRVVGVSHLRELAGAMEEEGWLGHPDHYVVVHARMRCESTRARPHGAYRRR
jgi:restriction system protein